MIMSQKTFRRPVLYSFFVASAACAVIMLSTALAAPLAGGLDSYQTLDASLDPTATQIPADFFDPGSDPFPDNIPLQGSPLGPGATTDTVIQRLAKAKFPGPPPKSGTVQIEIVALSLTSSSPITVTYSGGQNPEFWDVDVGLSPSPQPVGSMTIRQDAKGAGDFDLSLPVLLRLTFTRLSDSAVRVLDLPSLDLGARVVPWTSTTKTLNIIHDPGFCPACDSPDGDPANMFESGPGVAFDLVPATTVP
jgi:hypothetical protein